MRREIERISITIDLDAPPTGGMVENVVLDPQYYGSFGESRGALYGAARPLWMSEPLHRPASQDLRTP